METIIICILAIMVVVMGYCLYRLNYLLTEAAKRIMFHINDYCTLSDYVEYLRKQIHDEDVVSFEEYKNIKDQYVN